MPEIYFTALYSFSAVPLCMPIITISIKDKNPSKIIVNESVLKLKPRIAVFLSDAKNAEKA